MLAPLPILFPVLFLHCGFEGDSPQRNEAGKLIQFVAGIQKLRQVLIHFRHRLQSVS